MHEYVRKCLGIPILHAARITTPVSGRLTPNEIKEAPTVGGCPTILYRAIPRGELMSIMSEITGEYFTDEEMRL